MYINALLQCENTPQFPLTNRSVIRSLHIAARLPGSLNFSIVVGVVHIRLPQVSRAAVGGSLLKCVSASWGCGSASRGRSVMRTMTGISVFSSVRTRHYMSCSLFRHTDYWPYIACMFAIYPSPCVTTCFLISLAELLSHNMLVKKPQISLIFSVKKTFRLT